MSANSLPVSSVSTSIPSGNAKSRTADFVPSIWGDRFIEHGFNSNMTNHDNGAEQQIQKLKMEVKRMLAAADEAAKLNLVDQLQRLGIAYHFEREIDESLNQVHKLYFEFDAGTDYHDNLYTTALLFRLLRQQGYRVSCDVFQRFKDPSTGSFKESLVTDTRGLLSLYEASQLRVRGEEVLEEALVFTLTNLNRCIQESNDGDDTTGPAVAARVRRALKQCLRKGLTRVEARHHISIYESDASSRNEELLALAKLDFNLLQKQHQMELEGIVRWWREVDLARKLPFIRDRVVEGYFWTLGVYFEPQYSLARNIYAKIAMLTSVMDDIYDVYGKPEELALLTAAIERWDRKETCQLPEYMQVFYTVLMDVFDEFDEKLADVEGKSYRLFYGKEAMKIQARAYFDESKWLNEPEIPSFEEYMTVALVTSGYFMLLAISFLGMGEVITERAFEWSLSYSTKIVRASAVVCRLMDDIVSHKFEQKRGHVPSAVECYMKQHGVSEQQARIELWKDIEGAWKDINEEFLRPHQVPEPLLNRVLNLARVIDVLYKDKDLYTHPDLELEELVAVLLIDPIPS